MKSTFHVEFSGNTVESKELVANVKKIWTDAGNKVKDIKSLDLYVKPEENTVYYVINETESGSITLY